MPRPGSINGATGRDGEAAARQLAAEAVALLDWCTAQVEQAQLCMETLMRQSSENAMGTTMSTLRSTGATVRQAAAILDVSEHRVLRMLRRGELFGVRYGGRVGWRMPWPYLLEFANRWHGAPPARRRAVRAARRP